jgi:hypothetical protein
VRTSLSSTRRCQLDFRRSMNGSTDLPAHSRRRLCLRLHDARVTTRVYTNLVSGNRSIFCSHSLPELCQYIPVLLHHA